MIAVLRGGTVVDGTGTEALGGTTVVVADDRIDWVGPDGQVPDLPDARVVDLRSKFLIPGLWDMHTHPVSGSEQDIFWPLYLANGVTGVRVMMGDPRHHMLRDQIEQGSVLGPRMVIGSNIIDGPDSVMPLLGLGDPIMVGTPAEARAAIRQVKADNADFVKPYWFLRSDTHAAIMDEAQKVGLPVSGHLAFRITVAEASDRGQRSIEHLTNMLMATSSREAEFQHQINTLPVENPLTWLETVQKFDDMALDSHDPDRAEALYARLARNGTWQTPTFASHRLFTTTKEDLSSDPLLKYMPAKVRELYLLLVDRVGSSTPEQLELARELFQARLRVVGEMRQAGVGVLAGCDSGVVCPFPGFAVHDELSHLVDAGFTPMQALQSATRDVARYFENDEFGTIAVGKRADLVVLNQDPLADIQNIRDIHAVVTRGRFISTEEREKLLADAEAAAGTLAE